MKIRRGAGYTPKFMIEQITTPPAGILAQLVWGFAWGLVYFFLPLALLDLLRLWPLVGLPADTHYLEMCVLLFRLIIGR